MRARLRSLLASRLVHFLAIGAALFAVAPRASRRIDLSSRTLAALRAAEAARIAPAPLDAEHARAVDARAVEDELLYREALAQSLDKGDPIVRQRLIQKLLLLAEDLGGASRPPTEAEERAFFAATRDRWRRPDRLHFVHVFSTRKELLPPAEALPPDARAAPALGEAFPRARDVTAPADEIARDYGAGFAAAVARLGDGWSEPIASTFGWHRVRVVERLAGGTASFEEARARFGLDLQLDRRRRIVGRYLEDLAARYDVRVDGKPLRDFAPSGRVAARPSPSAED